MSANLVDASPRPIGRRSGLTVGPVGFGCWRFVHDSVTDARRVLEAALDAGLTLVDTADVYGLDWGGAGFGGAEELLGKVLADSPELRDRMVLATKGGIRPPVPYDSSPAWLREACEASLSRLGVDRIDLYQVHRADLFARPQEVAATLVALREEGKIGEIGVSNHRPSQYEALRAALDPAGVAMATVQPELSVVVLDPMRDGTLDAAQRDVVTPLAYSPLAGGRLVSGEGVRPELLVVLDELAQREGVDRASVALAFVLAHPSRPVALVGSQRPERLRAAAAATSVRLDRTDCYRMIRASDGVPLP